MGVKPVSNALHGGEVYFALRCNVGYGLDRRTIAGAGNFAGAGFTPVGDHFGGHLDMALQAEMGPEGVSLIRAVGTFEDACGLGGDGECLAMPMKCVEVVDVAKPALCGGVVEYRDLAPANLLDRIPADYAAECLGHELTTQAMAEEWNIGGDGGADQSQGVRNPGQVIVDAHGPAHKGEARKRCRVGRNRVVLVDGNENGRNAVAVEKLAQIARPFDGEVTEDGNRFHAYDYAANRVTLVRIKSGRE